ncbi:hypothetical protein BDV41DRAFT_579024 [Aspergillus transmontanensis]|uniref:Protein kinase domain-containing protein n=1 Tax=Aspergillus transmontanensis TaxID=1034304 RepID=A0A5N6VR59_9EURO|nr:hypothetical protein BDV41DRAFT_579024 [Aspergillus transmontanensis]
MIRKACTSRQTISLILRGNSKGKVPGPTDLEKLFKDLSKASDWVKITAANMIICVDRSPSSRIEAIREYSLDVADKFLRLFQQIQHEKTISAKECYRDGDRCYARVDDLPLTLEYLVNLRITEYQLSSIMSQTINSLGHLIASGFKHTALTCSNILLGSVGVVKIAALELCEQRVSGQSQMPFIKALAIIMMRLMQKYEKDDGLIGINDVKRWPLDSCAVDFLTTTSSVQPVEALQQHPFVAEHTLPRGELIGLARLAPITTKTFYSNNV